MSIQAICFAVSELIDRMCGGLEYALGVNRLQLAPCAAGMAAAPAADAWERAYPTVQFAEEKETPASSSEQPEAGSTRKNLLKDKVSSIMSVADDDDEDAELLEELSKPKKKFFGLFG